LLLVVVAVAEKVSLLATAAAAEPAASVQELDYL
jgi:hypothetical protein